MKDILRVNTDFETYIESVRMWEFIRDSLVDVFGKDRINAWASIYTQTLFAVYININDDDDTMNDIVKCLLDVV